MARDYYETLGVAPAARANEIRAAYRKLVLKHHPDKSSDPSAPQVFRGITEAFEVLGDPAARKKYDDAREAARVHQRESAERLRKEDENRKRRLREEADRAVRAAEPAAAATATRPINQFTVAEITEMVKRLGILFARQKVAESEALARQIIQVDPRRSLPYAVLGDVSRSRGNMGDAMKMYSFALQMEPANAQYLKRYEEILDRIHIEEGHGHRIKIEPQEKRMFAILAVAVITLLSCVYLVLSPEKPVLTGLSLISNWTIGVIAMLFISGASAGAALSIGNLIDRVDAYSSGRLPPTLFYGLISMLSFPISALLYAAMGSSQRSFNITTSRMMITVAGITVCLALGSAVSLGSTAFAQTLVWGGNLVYLGAMGGWAMADNLKR